MHQKANFVFLERVYDKNLQILLKTLYCAESKLNKTMKINRKKYIFSNKKTIFYYIVESCQKKDFFH